MLDKHIKHDGGLVVQNLDGLRKADSSSEISKLSEIIVRHASKLVPYEDLRLKTIEPTPTVIMHRVRMKDYDDLFPELFSENDVTVGAPKRKHPSRYTLFFGVSIAAILVAVVGISGLWKNIGILPSLSGSTNRRIAWKQVPSNVQLSVDAIDSTDAYMNTGAPRTSEVTRTPNGDVYHFVITGNFILTTLALGGSEQHIAKFVISIPSNDKTISSLKSYKSNGKLLWSKSNVPVINRKDVFSGTSTNWNATYSITRSAVLMRTNPNSYAQEELDSFKIRYTGSSPSQIKNIRYHFNLVHSGFGQGQPFPPSGVISYSSYGGSSGSKLVSYKGIKGTLDLSWGSHHEQLKLSNNSQ